ncbi:M14 family metallopeptidase [Williamwhitmania taraxaci]|uniref:Dipeptidyl-peptidase-4 n=1 Tax=Williamwhitmania taraxaci TaxID=1640674 RepID=A0A1G6NV95_9BACT|nr:M14 family metallopeptidase [Williamwhitmania taraxaci]SDC71852.1 dipeptidyl-peptidase-4 [Williamwhitmania taraxaci]
MVRISLLTIFLFFSLTVGYSQNVLQTVAEKSNFESTAMHADVMAYIAQLQKSSPNIKVELIAKTFEGRDIPLIIVANPMPKKPADLLNDKRVVVYIQANIHAGEVEGKEASLMYLRDLLKDKNSTVLNDVVLLVCPILNADGNDKISTQNRTHQNGPKNGVGVRYNGQYFDLNRDGMKVESPEIKGVITNVLNRWDPYVIMDCHTTNGSYHVEPVTFTWIMNPNCDRSLINYMRDRMMPEVSTTLRDKYQVENCFYGEFIDQKDYDKGWISYAAEPRYLSNYVGVRNRLGILNENYVYADYKSRVVGCYNLIHSVMDYSASHKAEIKELLNSADAATIARGLNPAVTDSFAVAYEGKPTPNKANVKTYEVDVVVDEQGNEHLTKSDRRRDISVTYIADYYATKNVKFPFAYILSIPDPEVISLLKIHGIKVERLDKVISLEVDKFIIEELKAAPKLNQGHYTETAVGHFVKETKEFPAGSYLVRTSQPLGYLVSYLMEPQSDDGLLFWNYFDRYLQPQWSRSYNPYPVYKVMGTTEIKSTVEI